MHLQGIAHATAPAASGDNVGDFAMATNTRFLRGAADVWLSANDNDFSHTCSDGVSVVVGSRIHPCGMAGVAVV